jgi:predicted esterase
VSSRRPTIAGARPRGRSLSALAVGFALSAVGCGGSTGPHALFDLHQPNAPIDVPTATRDFYALPFPNDLRLAADGTLDLTAYPHSIGTVAEYIQAVDDNEHGFGENAGAFFRFDAPLDPASLPANYAASMAPAATAFLVDITPDSPTYDRRTPVLTRFTAFSYDFIGPNWVALIPYPGLPMREKTTYAAVLTDGLRGAGGDRVRRAADFDALVADDAARSADPVVAAAAPAYAPLRAWLTAHPDVAAHVVDAAVFTTSDATAIMAKLRAAVYAQAPAPTLAGLVYDGEDQAGVNDVYEATYQGPNFQAGDPFDSGSPPYANGGGNLVFDAAGVPQLQRMETLRIAISVPKGDPPAAGWPVVIFQHGTGGDYKSFIRNATAREAARVTDAAGNVIAELAMVGTDQVLHGTRSPAGTDYDTAFFNFVNIAAAHDNPKQGALDGFQVVRLLHAIDQVAPTTGKRLKFDVDRIYFKGHSQGGLTGPLFLAAEPEVKAAILSGAGGDLIYSLLNKTEPNDIPRVVQALLHDPADEFHPLLSLVQGYFEDSDPINYARHLFSEPLPGVPPKSIFQSLGLIDHYTPVPNIKALALAMGVQPVGPELDDIDGLDYTHATWAQAPVSGNVAAGQATGVLLEYTAPANDDGHFVVFDVPEAVAQSNRFLATHAAAGAARLDPP